MSSPQIKRLQAQTWTVINRLQHVTPRFELCNIQSHADKFVWVWARQVFTETSAPRKLIEKHWSFWSPRQWLWICQARSAQDTFVLWEHARHCQSNVVIFRLISLDRGKLVKAICTKGRGFSCPRHWLRICQARSAYLEADVFFQDLPFHANGLNQLSSVQEHQRRNCHGRWTVPSIFSQLCIHEYPGATWNGQATYISFSCQSSCNSNLWNMILFDGLAVEKGWGTSWGSLSLTGMLETQQDNIACTDTANPGEIFTLLWICYHWPNTTTHCQISMVLLLEFLALKYGRHSVTRGTTMSRYHVMRVFLTPHINAILRPWYLNRLRLK